MHRRRRSSVVPQPLVDEIAQALGQVDDRLDELGAAVAASAPWEERRVLRRRLRAAFDHADRLLREATALTRGRSHLEWSRWRHRLSRLSLARQVMLFAESDDFPVLPTGSVRVIDTGMSGPALGELQHGESRDPGAHATYGLDLDAALASRAAPPAADRPGTTGTVAAPVLVRRVAAAAPIPSRSRVPVDAA